MFVAGTALLPSTFSMYFGCAALAAWWHQRYPLAIFLVAISALLGWPFAAIIGLPLCYDILVVQRKFKLFAFWTIVSGATVLLPMIAIDSAYFGKLTVAPFNIVYYNVFTSHGGPDLYGTEKWTFYFVNGFLNYNVIWLLALATPAILGAAAWLIPSKTSSTLYLPYYLSLAPFYIWLLVFWVQPHKEERFLYPIYPMIALCGAISIDTIQKLFYRLKTHFKQLPSRSHYLDHTTWLAIVVLILSSVLGLSRITSMYFNYHAPMELMIDFNHNSIDGNEPVQTPGRIQNVCMGKDWYRFPGSFFLPSSDYRIRFVKSEFTGILPAYYAEGDNGTTLVHDHFNDMNRENPKMYSNQSDCHFMFDLEVNGSGTKLEPNYVQRINDWSVAKQVPFLDAERSRGIYRSFYIPWITDRYVHYAQFNLLKSKKNKRK